MKKLLLLFVIVITASAVSGQYQGTPWYGDGNPWTFGEDSAANLRVGNGIASKKDFFNGVPHSAYDVGVVDTASRAGDDPDGTLVAGAGVSISAGTNDDYRRPQASADGVTLTPSDIAAIESPNYGAAFTSHENRGVTGKSGAWFRYTCDFTKEGNYSMVWRYWDKGQEEYAGWVRFYDKATMEPLYPWTKFNPGFEGLESIITSEAPLDTIVSNGSKAGVQDWWEMIDRFTLSGEVVVEYSDAGPTEAYGDNARGSGSGAFGEFVFFYTGESADEYAPVAGPYMDAAAFTYDDMMDFSLNISEAGTLYLVPDGTAIEDAATTNIDMMEMTADDTYTLDMTTLDLPVTFQIVTMDAAGNSRITTPLEVQKAFTADTTQGETGDTIWVNTTRSGYVALVPASVSGNRSALELAIATGGADTVNVTGGLDSLVISNLTGDQNCKLFLVDEINDEVSYAIDFQLGEGGVPESVELKDLQDIKVSMLHNAIVVQHEADFDNLVVYDILGKQHIRIPVESRRVTVDANSLNDGVYIIRMTGNSGVATKKFLLNR